MGVRRDRLVPADVWLWLVVARHSWLAGVFACVGTYFATTGKK